LSSRGKKDALWLLDLLQQRLDEIYQEDLIREGVLSRLDIKYPRDSVIRALENDAELGKAGHAHVTEMPPQDDYVANSLMPLFRSRRSSELAKLLSTRAAFQSVQFEKYTRRQFRSVKDNPVLAQSISRLVASIRSRSVGIHMMDITTCGAVAPYNHLLGGKLVAMFATSPEVVHYYNTKYSEKISNIASKVATHK